MTVGDTQVSLGPPQQRALLALLLLNANQVVSRDRLVDELWGAHPPATAAKLVQVYVSRLRKALAARSAGGGELLITRAPGYLLSVEQDELDLLRFERLASEGRVALERGQAREASNLLREALALWRGPPLADFTFERFAETEIGRLEELRVSALEDRIDADLALGRGDLVAELESLIARHPLRERLRGQLMLALYRAGRQTEALEAYRRTTRTLLDEAGVEPAPKLKRLEEAILAHDPELDAPPAGADLPTPEPVAESLERGNGASVEGVPGAGHFVGREPELASLLAGLDSALVGQGRLLLVAGEPGIGKSRLLEELAARARERDARVLWGRCWEAGGAPAYWPWVQSMREYVRAIDEDALRDQLGRGASEVAQVLPELRELLGELPELPTMDPETARFRTFEAVASFLAAAAGLRPLVLVLDDVHAADEPSLLLLRFVSDRLKDAPILIAAAYRDVELEPDTPLAGVVAEVARTPAADAVTLAGLGHDDVRRLIEASAGIRPPEGSVAAIQQRTEGNPLFVGEVVRLLASEGRLTEVGATEAEPLPIPPGVREVIGRRLRQLSDSCREILTLAAVLGREFDFDALVHVSERPEDELLDAVEEGLRAGVLSEVPGSPSRLRFAHVLIRDALYGELAGPRRLRLHRDVGEALEARYADDLEPRLAELAHHFAAAGSAGDPGKAVEYARAAGGRAVTLLAYEEAVRLYRLALSALSPEHPDGDSLRCELLLAVADAQDRAGDGPGAKSTFIEAAELARSAGLPELLARAAISYGGRFLWMRGSSDARLVPLLEDALAALDESDSVLRVRVQSSLASALRDEPLRTRREQLRDEAIVAARRIGDPTTLAYTLDASLAAIEGPLRLDEQAGLADEIIALADEIGDPERLFAGHEHGFWRSWTVGDPARRARHLAAMRRVAEDLRQPAQLWLATAAEAAVAVADGRFDDATELIERAAAIGERALSWSAASTRRLQDFALRREREQLTGLDSVIRGLGHEFPSPLIHRSVLAYICARQGQRSEAEEILNELTGHDLSDWHLDEDWLFSICLLAEACWSLGESERGGLVYDVLSPHAPLNGVAVGEVGLDSVSRPLGMLATLLGRFDDAVRHFEEAVAMNATMGARPGLAHAEYAYAQMLALRDQPGDAERGLELIRRAGRGYAGLDMQTFAHKVEELERDLSARSQS